MTRKTKRITFFITFFVALCFASFAGGADLSKHIFLTIETPGDTFYVNQKIPVKVKLYSDWLDLEDITLWEASSEDLIVEKFGDRKVSRVRKNGVNYIVLEYASSIFGVTPGRLTLEPVKVKMKVARPAKEAGAELINDNADVYEKFIGAADSRALALETKPVEFTLLPLPTRGQPADFKGAVGDFKFKLEAGPTKLETGEVVRLVMTITGTGNYDTVTVPRIKRVKGLRAYDPRVMMREDSVVFEQRITVKSPKIKEIPEAIFNFFDPAKKRYISLKEGPVAIEVEGEELLKETEDKAPKEVKREILGPKESPGRLTRRGGRFYQSKAFVLFEIFPLMAILVAIVVHARMKFLQENPLYAARLAASKKASADIGWARSRLKKGDAKGFYDAIFTITQEYLGTRLLRSAAGISEETLDELESRGLEEEALGALKEIFSDCHVARFTTAKSEKGHMKEVLKKLAGLISDLNKKTEL